jgi:AraC family transcriptional regulator
VGTDAAAACVGRRAGVGGRRVAGLPRAAVPASFGLGVAAGLERARCSRVETLLIRTDLTLDTVARQCGFADGSHLSHRFTAIHGVPPRDYRRAGQVPSVLDDPGVRRLARLIWD